MEGKGKKTPTLRNLMYVLKDNLDNFFPPLKEGGGGGGGALCFFF